MLSMHGHSTSNVQWSQVIAITLRLNSAVAFSAAWAMHLPASTWHPRP